MNMSDRRVGDSLVKLCQVQGSNHVGYNIFSLLLNIKTT